MPTQDIMQVCLNGHRITDTYLSSPINRKNFCTVCGEKTITKCPNCDASIKGDIHYENAMILGYPTPVPDICDNCGKDFPWKETKSNVIKSIENENLVDGITLLESICNKFHLVAKQIRQRYNDRTTLDIKDEYDVQDLLHSLLRIFFEDIRPEEWNPSYAGASSRSDFLLKDEKIVIEVKKTRPSLKTKELGDQLIIDIEKYKNHPDCEVLYCFVYDPDGYVVNPVGLASDLSRDEDNFKVIVNIVPKGY